MTIRVIVTVIYSKESHLDISQIQAFKALKNILLKMNHKFSKIEHKLARSILKKCLYVLAICLTLTLNSVTLLSNKNLLKMN